MDIEHPKPTRWLLPALSLAMLLPSLDTSIANVALPTLAETWGASFGEVKWVVLAYLLALTAFIVGDRHAGTRRLSHPCCARCSPTASSPPASRRAQSSRR
jgi:MFS family permease